MEANSNQETLENTSGFVAMGASTDNSAKSRILERIKVQMAKESLEPGDPLSGTSIYLKAPDWPI